MSEAQEIERVTHEKEIEEALRAAMEACTHCGRPRHGYKHKDNVCRYCDPDAYTE